MITLAAEMRVRTSTPGASLRSPLLIATGVVLLFLLTGLAAFHEAFVLWTADPLRSIGLLFPVVAALFLFRAIRSFDRSFRGNGWGLLPCATAVGILLLREHYLLQLHLGRLLQIDPAPAGVALSLLAAGILVLFGGLPLLQACILPVVLLGLTNPVPHVLSDHFDLPLQQASANAARQFAALIGERPSGNQLRIMFTPNFGMFIAPGCNGIRGASALGYLALFAAAWRRFPWQRCAASFAGGVLVGYLFNFIRLFTLVLYYKAGQWWPAIQPYGTQVDYAIGGTLFLLASYAIGRILFGSTGARTAWATRSSEHFHFDRRLAVRLAALLLLCVGPMVDNVSALVRDTREHALDAPPSDLLPPTVGDFHLSREWNERTDEGIPAYHWGSYRDSSSGDEVALGLWLPPFEHDVRYSHTSRGQTLTTLQPIAHRTPGIGLIVYNTYTYDDGTDDVLLAALACRPCDGVPTGYTAGPFQMLSTSPLHYFRRPLAHTAVLTNAAPRQTSSAAELSRPVKKFIAALDEKVLWLGNPTSSPN